MCNVFEKQNEKQFHCKDSIGIENVCPESFQQHKNKKKEAFTRTNFKFKNCFKLFFFR